MGLIGGFFGFVVSFLACNVLALIFLPALPWTALALMLALCACVVGIVLSLAFAPIMGALFGAGVGITRLAALLFVGVLALLVFVAWQPVLWIVFTFTAFIPGIAFQLGMAGLGLLLAAAGLLAVLVVQLVLSGITYILAAIAYGTLGQSPMEAEARGACAGVNTAINLLLYVLVIPPYLLMALGPLGGLLAVAVLAGILTASVVPFLRNPATGIVPPAGRTAIGWLVCLLPTAWLMELLGLLLFIMSLLVHGTIGMFVPMFTITAMRVRTDTGSVIVTGGMAGNLNPAPTYNIGTFTFVRTITPALIPVYFDPPFFAAAASVQNHEIGHQLNLAAYGSAFNLIGFVDEWLGPIVSGAGTGYAIYGEDLASTNDPTPTPFFPTPLSMWVV